MCRSCRHRPNLTADYAATPPSGNVISRACNTCARARARNRTMDRNARVVRVQLVNSLFRVASKERQPRGHVATPREFNPPDILVKVFSIIRHEAFGRERDRPSGKNSSLSNSTKGQGHGSSPSDIIRRRLIYRAIPAAEGVRSLKSLYNTAE